MPKNQMNRMLPQDDYNNWESRGGKMPIKRKTAHGVEPELPKVKELLRVGKINVNDIREIATGRRNVIRNDDGVRFTGYHVSFTNIDGKEVSGWMPTSDFVMFRRELAQISAKGLDNLEF
jgi:hypothetical protein